MQLIDLEVFLSDFLFAEQFTADQNGVYRPSAAPVRRLGLALEPWPGIADWVRDQNLDALFLHRPWKLGALPENVGVLAYHYAFDERLTTGYNPLLAVALGFAEVAVLGHKEGRPLGMIGDVTPMPFAAFRSRVETEFGGLENAYGAHGGKHQGDVRGAVTRACVVGALRPALVYEAAQRGAQVYLTGEYRKSAAQAMADTGLSVLELGHQRSEAWGLRTLARTLRAQFPDLTVVLPET